MRVGVLVTRDWTKAIPHWAASFLFFILEARSPYIAQVGLNWQSCIHLPTRGDYTCVPSCPFLFRIFCPCNPLVVFYLILLPYLVLVWNLHCLSKLRWRVVSILPFSERICVKLKFSDSWCFTTTTLNWYCEWLPSFSVNILFPQHLKNEIFQIHSKVERCKELEYGLRIYLK